MNQSQSVTPNGMTPDEHVRMLAEKSPQVFDVKASSEEMEEILLRGGWPEAPLRSPLGLVVLITTPTRHEEANSPWHRANYGPGPAREFQQEFYRECPGEPYDLEESRDPPVVKRDRTVTKSTLLALVYPRRVPRCLWARDPGKLKTKAPPLEFIGWQARGRLYDETLTESESKLCREVFQEYQAMIGDCVFTDMLDEMTKDAFTRSPLVKGMDWRNYVSGIFSNRWAELSITVRLALYWPARRQAEHEDWEGWEG